jgi:hypothetical protein
MQEVVLQKTLIPSKVVKKWNGYYGRLGVRVDVLKLYFAIEKIYQTYYYRPGMDIVGIKPM